MKPDLDYKLRQAIIKTIDARGITKTDLCRRTGVKRLQLWRFLTGRGDMTGYSLDRIRIALGLLIVDPLTDPED